MSVREFFSTWRKGLAEYDMGTWFVTVYGGCLMVIGITICIAVSFT